MSNNVRYIYMKHVSNLLRRRNLLQATERQLVNNGYTHMIGILLKCRQKLEIWKSEATIQRIIELHQHTHQTFIHFGRKNIQELPMASYELQRL